MKRTLVLLASVALVAAGLSVPAAGQEAPAQPTEVPATVLIEDPYGDANALGGDNTSLPADGGSQTDIGKVWFSNDATNFQVHFLTEGPPTATSFGFKFEVSAGPDGCLFFEGFTKGTSYQSDNLARVTDGCNGLDRLAEGTSIVFAAGPGGEGGLATITVPRSYSPLFNSGAVIDAPTAATMIFAGNDALSPAGVRGVAQPIDDTKVGTAYTVTGGPAAPEEPVPPAKPKPKPGKGKPKGCDKGKGKKKGCPTRPPAPVACPAMTPAEAGAGKPTITLTDTATEAAPLEQKVTLGQSTADLQVGEASHDAFNVQVDSAAAEAGFYALIEFPQREDRDISMMYDDGSYAARSHAWNTIIEANEIEFPALGPLSTTGHGGESTASSEKLVGIKVADCSGWTIDVANYLGNAGEASVKLWLGEAKTEPQAMGEEPGS